MRFVIRVLPGTDALPVVGEAPALSAFGVPVNVEARVKADVLGSRRFRSSFCLRRVPSLLCCVRIFRFCKQLFFGHGFTGFFHHCRCRRDPPGGLAVVGTAEAENSLIYGSPLRPEYAVGFIRVIRVDLTVN